jgi:hypothetical protein
MRTAAGVIAGFCSLILIFLLGGIVFYRILGATDPASLPATWQPLYTVMDSIFGIGLGIYIFAAALCIITPLAWIFMGIKSKEEEYYR